MPKKQLTLSDQVRQAVRASGIPGRRIAEAVGVTPSMISYWLNGHVEVSAFTLAEIGKLLDLSIVGPGPKSAVPSDFPDRRYKQHKGK